MKTLIKLFFIILLLFSISLMVGLLYSLENKAIVKNKPLLTTQDRQRARLIIYKNDPRKFPAGSQREISLTNKDLTLTGNYLLQFLLPKVFDPALISQLSENSISLKSSFRLPNNPIGTFLNIHIDLISINKQLIVQQLSIGKIHFPTIITRQLSPLFLFTIKNNHYWQLLQATLQDFSLSKQALIIHYRWKSIWEILAQNKMNHLSNTEAVQFYDQQLMQQTNLSQKSFEQIITELFQQAKTRSATHDPIQDNQAIFQVLGQWALNTPSLTHNKLPPFALKLKDRIDLAKHFLVSAAIAAHSTSVFSDLIGVSKELKDANGGSGFSFSDLAADLSGSELGKKATINKQMATQTQGLLSQTHVVQHLMPNTDLLPPPMSKVTFDHRYGSTQSDQYHQQVNMIKQQIYSLPFFIQIDKKRP